ncbi:MAG: Tripartite-type tricarboxylate transporter, receptor component TctC [Hyphomicrobiales bacterium]|nr:Tripartite-type tricarboxylate transporter, receptor component TctC [Hyphomicrobiales bacterium]
MTIQRSGAALACGLALTAALAGAASAADEDMFKGKTITVYIGFSPGGTYDLFGRMVTRYMARHIPGQPNMVASNMPGAGSFTASNWLYRIAPKDGTALGTVSQTLAIDEALKSKGVQFKAAEFNWIGRVTSNVEVQVVSTRTEGQTLAGARKVVVPTASTGPGSPSDTYPKLMNEVAGTQFKIIRGFPGSTDGLLAVERGETDSALTSWNTMKTTRMNWLTDKKAVLFVQYVTKRSPDLKDVPTLVELASNDADRKLLSFAVSSAEIGRSILGPPGMQADRVAVLRKAFDAAMKDPEMLAEIQKSNLDFEPLDGASLAKIVAEAANADPSVVARMQKIMEE